MWEREKKRRWEQRERESPKIERRTPTFLRPTADDHTQQMHDHEESDNNHRGHGDLLQREGGRGGPMYDNNTREGGIV